MNNELLKYLEKMLEDSYHDMNYNKNEEDYNFFEGKVYVLHDVIDLVKTLKTSIS